MKTSKYTYELLYPLVKSSKSMAEVIRKLGLKQSGGMQRMLNGRLAVLRISKSHFSGSLWSKGTTKATNPSVAKQVQKITLQPRDVLRKGVYVTSDILRRCFFSTGVPYVCTVCGIDSWLAKPITLHLDHINGVHTDNRVVNLRFLCPNCHQQTHTWGKHGPVVKSKTRQL